MIHNKLPGTDPQTLNPNPAEKHRDLSLNTVSDRTVIDSHDESFFVCLSAAAQQP